MSKPEETKASVLPEEVASTAEEIKEAAEQISDTPAEAPVQEDVKPDEEEVCPIPEPSLRPKEETPVKTGYGDNILPTGKYAIISTGGYLLNQLLFLLPVIGLIGAIIMAICARNVNRRRHALSAIILHVLGLMLLAGLVGISMLFGADAVMASVKEWLEAIIK